MEIIQVVVGSYQANCYIVYKEKEGLIIDPGAEGEKILKIVENLGLNIKYILLTHGHGDHIGAVDFLKFKLDSKVFIDEKDSEMLGNIEKNLSFSMLEGPIKTKADLLYGEEELNIADINIDIINTPGHTRGGVTIKILENLFTGDTLFKESIGRTDFPGGNSIDIMNSINRKIMNNPDSYLVLPGHGDITNIKHEKTYNKFIKI